MAKNYLSEVTEFDREAAKKYRVHVAFIMAIKRGEWGAVKLYAQQQWNRDGWVCLKRNKNAVDRILKVFGELKGIPDYGTDIEIKKKIAIYVQHLGVARLIDDMRDALKVNPQIRTIKYFLQTGGGAHECRWGNLYYQRQNEIYEKEKAEYRKDAVFFRDHILEDEPVKKIEPEWVRSARKRLKELQEKKLLTQAENQERATLEMRLKLHLPKGHNNGTL